MPETQESHHGYHVGDRVYYLSNSNDGGTVTSLPTQGDEMHEGMLKIQWDSDRKTDDAIWTLITVIESSG